MLVPSPVAAASARADVGIIKPREGKKVNKNLDSLHSRFLQGSVRAQQDSELHICIFHATGKQTILDTDSLTLRTDDKHNLPITGTTPNF